MQVSKGEVLQSLFGTRDPNYHAQLRRAVSNAFSMTSIVQYEPRVNETVRVFLAQTERLYAAPEKKCDSIRWIQYFAFDVITEVTYSKRVGFIDRVEDVDGIISWLDGLFDYAAPVSTQHNRLLYHSTNAVTSGWPNPAFRQDLCEEPSSQATEQTWIHR